MVFLEPTNAKKGHLTPYWAHAIALQFAKKTPRQGCISHMSRCNMWVYSFNGTSFGLSNAPGRFTRTMNVELLAPMQQSAVVYINRFEVFPHSAAKHVYHVKQVFAFLRDAEESLELGNVVSLQT